MSKPENIFPVLSKACPGIKKAWEEHLEYWGKDERGRFTDISVFAHYIVESFSSGNTVEFEKFFDEVESLLKSENEEVKAVISIGLLEDIQDVASHQPFGYQVFEKWLKPISMKAWKDIEATWNGKLSLMDIVRSETKAIKKENNKS